MNPILRSVLAAEYDALVIGNGDAPPAALVRELAGRAGRLIAVDGGSNALRRLGLPPHYVMGDLDSAEPATLRWARSAGAELRPLPDQADSDLPKALRECRRLGVRSVVALGLVSERVDHTLVSLAGIARANGLHVTLVSRHTVVLPLRGRAVAERALPVGTTFSWLPLDACTGCSLEGARWPFRNRSLAPAGFYSLSNVAVAPLVRLRQRSGLSLWCVNYTV